MFTSFYRSKRMIMVPAVAILMALATACGSTATKQDASNAAAPTESAKPASVPAKSNEPLVVYLNDFDEMIKPLFEQATGHKLELVVGNGAEIASRIEAEKGNPRWDVVWMDSMPTIDTMGKNGQLLDNWTPKNMDNLTDFAKKLVPANKSYYPTGAHAAGVIVYNTKAYDANSAPKSWKELSDPKYKGAVGMADPMVLQDVKTVFLI